MIGTDDIALANIAEVYHGKHFVCILYLTVFISLLLFCVFNFYHMYV